MHKDMGQPPPPPPPPPRPPSPPPHHPLSQPPQTQYCVKLHYTTNSYCVCIIKYVI